MIDINITHKAAETCGLDWDALLVRAEKATLDALPAYKDLVAECSVIVCDDATIQGLNADFRAKDKPTNVLSFPQFDAFEVPKDGEHYIGDIAMSYDTLAREASDGDVALADHATHLFVHSFLHLFGYDHIDDADAELMEALEIRILATLNIKNPYLIHEEL
ncbi:MAG: rRNA maturation RNase YbeY [Pseudomonadota bacterium]